MLSFIDISMAIKMRLVPSANSKLGHLITDDVVPSQSYGQNFHARIALHSLLANSYRFFYELSFQHGYIFILENK